MIWTTLSLLQLALNLLLAVIDVFALTYIFYKFYQILAQTKAVQVIKGLFFFVILYIISKIFALQTFSWFLDQIAAVLVIAIIVLFQPELRRVLTKIGQSNWLSSIAAKDPKDISSIMNALENLQLLKIGALIVFERNVGLRNIIESGTILNAKISTSIILTIFSKKTPLHDGAVIIKNSTIIAAGCFLPLSDAEHLKKDFGTRHRAALGIAEECDAVVIVVSEETGRTSLAYDGRLFPGMEPEIIRKELINLLGYEDEIDSKEFLNDKK